MALGRGKTPIQALDISHPFLLETQAATYTLWPYVPGRAFPGEKWYRHLHAGNQLPLAR